MAERGQCPDYYLRESRPQGKKITKDAEKRRRGGGEKRRVGEEESGKRGDFRCLPFSLDGETLIDADPH
jgi:hypothetical protein